MIVKLLSGQLYEVNSPTIKEAKQYLSTLLSLPAFYIKLLDPESGLPLETPIDNCLLYCDNLDTTDFKEYEHYPNLFLKNSKHLIYPKLSPEEFKRAIASIDTITENNTIIYQMTHLFDYLCRYLHPYAYVDYFPLLSNHFGEEEIHPQLYEALLEKDFPTEELVEIYELTIQKLGKK